MAETHYENKDQVRRYLQSIRVSGEYLLGIINKVMHTTQQEDMASADPDANAEGPATEAEGTAPAPKQGGAADFDDDFFF